jgi:hypothetical protein
MKLKYIGWFFYCMWWCLKDFVSGPISCFQLKLWQEDWGDFKIKLHFDRDPELIALTNSLNETALSRYSEKSVDPKFYQTIKISGGTETQTEEQKETIKEYQERLTKEAFQSGKAGYIWVNNKTGKIDFKDGE